jgi:hypothetical protein
MADLSITAANVALAGSSALTRRVQVGEAVAQGQPGYYVGSENKYYQTDADDSATKADAKCIFLTPAAADGYAVICESGEVNLGATLTVGTTYVVSATKGGIAPIGDLTTDDYVTILGIATSASTLQLDIQAGGVQIP